MDPFQTIAAVVLGLMLSATCGLRAFLPLGIVSGLGLAGLLDLPDALSWMASPVALICFGIATVMEIVADKIPVVDNAMDTVGTLLRPAAGALVGGAILAGADPLVACVFGLAGGTLIAGAAHASKATIRAGSTTTTAGTANPFLSLLEDVAVVGIGTLAAVGAIAVT